MSEVGMRMKQKRSIEGADGKQDDEGHGEEDNKCGGTTRQQRSIRKDKADKEDDDTCEWRRGVRQDRVGKYI